MILTEKISNHVICPNPELPSVFVTSSYVVDLLTVNNFIWNHYNNGVRFWNSILKALIMSFS